MLKEKKKEKVVVGMSSGVDSSATAGILKNQGYEVLGVFMQFWKDSRHKEDDIAIRDVKRVARVLDIPIKILDVRKEFQEKVVGYFLKEYSKGKTPNPCVFCNENLKFKILFDEMKKDRADFVATGHYAQIKKQEESKNTHYQLLEAKDKNKDQSYFLYRLKQKQLAKIIFPLGDKQKTETRKLAKKFGLPVFDKAESQDICFLGKKSVEEFLTENIKLKKGNIIDTSREVIGEHLGLPLYTLGQRKGINIGGTGPYYVTKKDMKKNRLVVTNKKEDLFLFSKFANLKEVNWILPKPTFPFKVLVRIRYRSLLASAVVKNKRDRYEIIFDMPQRALTKGQSMVFYSKKEEVLGGGIIS